MDRYKYRFLSLSLYLYMYIDFIGWWILVRTQHKHFLDTSTDNHKKYLTTKQTSKMYARIYTPIIYVYIYIYICVCVCVVTFWDSTEYFLLLLLLLLPATAIVYKVSLVLLAMPTFLGASLPFSFLKTPIFSISLKDCLQENW